MRKKRSIPHRIFNYLTDKPFFKVILQVMFIFLFAWVNSSLFSFFLFGPWETLKDLLEPGAFFFLANLFLLWVGYLWKKKEQQRKKTAFR